MKQQAIALSDGLIHLQLLPPIDNELTLLSHHSPEEKRANTLKIRRANKAIIHKCHAVITNLSLFRSTEPDCGTASPTL